jgi:hypothetical protein
MRNLAQVFPFLRRFEKLPLSRDEFILLMVALNEILLGIEIYMGHSISGTIVPNEWIPIIFGPLAGILLLVLGLFSRRQRMLANILASIIYWASIGVGLLGAFFHIRRAILPTAPLGEWVSIGLLVWGPPVLAPLTFALVGVLGLSATWAEQPPESGRLILAGGKRLSLPLSKTRVYYLLVGLGILASLISMVDDHARTGFTNPWLWFSSGVAVFATVVAVILGALDKPAKLDVALYAFAMLGLIALGILGLLLHVMEDLTAQGQIVVERFIRGAPFLAPLLFADMGAFGLLSLLDPGADRGAQLPTG